MLAIELKEHENLPSGHSRYRWVCLFIRTEMWHYITFSAVDPLQWMGAVRMRAKQLIKPSQLFTNDPHGSSPSINILWRKKTNQKIIKMFLTSNHWVWLKCKSLIHNIALTSVNQGLWTGILARSNSFKFKNILMMQFWCNKMLTDGLESCGSLVIYYQTLFLMAPIHCRGSIGEEVM